MSRGRKAQFEYRQIAPWGNCIRRDPLLLDGERLALELFLDILGEAFEESGVLAFVDDTETGTRHPAPWVY